MIMDNVYYTVIFNDGDIDIPLAPEFDDPFFENHPEFDGEDYDPTNFEMVSAYAKTIKNSRIDATVINVKKAL